MGMCRGGGAHASSPITVSASHYIPPLHIFLPYFTALTPFKGFCLPSLPAPPPILSHTQLELLNMEPTFLNRNVNEGFSGGEKKRNEILQLAVLEVRCGSVKVWRCGGQHSHEEA